MSAKPCQWEATLCPLELSIVCEFWNYINISIMLSLYLFISVWTHWFVSTLFYYYNYLFWCFNLSSIWPMWALSIWSVNPTDMSPSYCKNASLFLDHPQRNVFQNHLVLFLHSTWDWAFFQGVLVPSSGQGILKQRSLC